jgi:hypothetical protein
MDRAAFWELIDKTRSVSDDDSRRQSELLINELAQRSPEDIMAFQTIHTGLFDDAYIADLWDAAFVISCGCSDDGFMDFRDWLIARGEAVFRGAIDDPESLVDVAKYGDKNMYPTLLGVEPEAYKRATGNEMPGVFRDRPDLKGKLRDESEKLVRFPKLAAKFWQPFLDELNTRQTSSR